MNSTKPMRRILHDDSGYAMATVMGVMAIVFMMLSSLFVLTNYRTMQADHFSSRMTAVQLADAGLNHYLYRLSLNYDYYLASPTPQPSMTTAQGSWVASATFDTASQLIIVRSVGTDTKGVSRVVVAKCSPPPPPMYAIGSGANIDVGANTTITGPVRSNGYVHIATGGTAGIITGLAQSGTNSPNGDFSPTVSGKPAPTRFKGGALYYAPLSFDQMSTDVATMKTVAQLKLSSSRADGKTPAAKGYEITLSNNQVIVERVTAESRDYQTKDNHGVYQPDAVKINKLGTLTTVIPTGVQSVYAIPANGVIYVDGDNVWVRGTYTARVTICASRASSTDTTYGNITVANSILCGNMSNPTVVAGLMAQNSIWLPDWYSETVMDPTLTIQAALLAQYKSIGDACGSSFPLPTSNNGTYPQHDLDLSGSALGCTGVGFQTQYFITREYGFDSRLTANPPPYWPRGNNSWVLVSSWLEG